jgi:hypothetical protein
MCDNPNHHDQEDCENARSEVMSRIAEAPDEDLASMLVTSGLAFIDAHSQVGTITPFMMNYMELMNAFAKRIGDPDLDEIVERVTADFHSALIVFEAEFEAWRSATEDLGEGA